MLIRRRTVEDLHERLERLALTLDDDAEAKALAGDFKTADAHRAMATAYVHAAALVESRLLPRRRA